MTKPILALTMGDPAGVGPEIIAKALNRQDVLDRCKPLVIGSKRALQRAFRFTNTFFSYRTIQEFDEFDPEWPCVTLLNDETHLRGEIPLARVDATCGASAYAWLIRAIRLAAAQQVAAIVTAPLHKEALNLAGHHYAGHTEILAEETSVKEYSLMLIAGKFRVTHVTCHVAVKDVSSFLSKERIVSVIRLFDNALTRLDGKRPRIAVCALNPHGGEAGLFGDEEIQFIRPAVEQCASEGVQVYGPFPSDSIYPQHVGGKYEGVVAMYHDQGHIAFKLCNFHFDPQSQEWSAVTGVNVCLGLPIIRTSVDHGTAFDLAGSGKASAQSLLDAIHVALKLVH
ncbi:MAG: 4-hydroxythreonine-4-phosphate dehydrogenase PdxA [Candidatus Omnitrophota bacterium]|jgi:4-hydroxythreonine-4-phosphate dehydrogenase|nr:MAG: 4-hydroxythreonine-4-phosphate dehydrogenase PdxA [Candidatus Omnitrophota bacterium]